MAISIPVDVSEITNAAHTTVEKSYFVSAFGSVQTHLENMANGVQKFEAMYLGGVTTAQRDALSPQTGWVVLNTTDGEIQWYDGADWQAVGGAEPLTFSDGTGVDLTETAGEVVADLNLAGLSSKANPVAADIIPLADSEASNAAVRGTIQDVIDLAGGVSFDASVVALAETTDITSATMAILNASTWFAFTPLSTSFVHMWWTHAKFQAGTAPAVLQLRSLLNTTQSTTSPVATGTTRNYNVSSTFGDALVIYVYEFTGLTAGQQYYVIPQVAENGTDTVRFDAATIYQIAVG